MTENRINFYLGKLGNEDWICSCDELDLMGEPDNEREMYVIMQKYISDSEISYFCKPYNWED